MSRWFIPAAAVAAAVAIITAGCASAGATGLGTSNGAASIVPADAVAFVAASTDLGSSRWHGLAKPFLNRFQTYAPALGGELDVAVLPGKQVVAFTQPQDAGKLDALAAKHGAKTRVIGDWTAIAKTSAALDTVAGSTSHLADSNVFADAMNELPGGALVRAYANGDEAAQLLASLHTGAFAGSAHFKWAAAALTSEGAGLRVQAFVQPASGAPSAVTPYHAALVDEIPAGVLAVADFQAPNGTLPPQLEQLLGKNRTSELGNLLGGETAVYVQPGMPIPEVTLITQPHDVTAAAAALDSLLAGVPLHGVQLVHADVGGRFVVSTSQAAIDELRSGGAKLSSDPSFLQAEQQAGAGDQTTGLLYANVKDALPLLQLAGVTLPQGLPNLGTVFAYGAQSNGQSTFSAFLGVG